MRTSCQLPKPVRMRVIWAVRDYERMRMEYDEALWDSPGPPDGQPRGTKISNPTERKGMQRAELSRTLEAIEQAFNTVPEEYRQGVWNNVVYRISYPIDAGSATYARHKGKFLYRAAKNLYLI